MLEKSKKVIIRPNGNTISIQGDHLTLESIRNDFAFYVPGAHFTPAFKRKSWDGKKRFIGGGLNVATAPIGLMYLIVKWFKERDYDIDWKDYRIPIKYNHINPILGNIELYDYQVEAVKTCLNIGGGIIKLPTGSGKSAIITAIIKETVLTHPDILFVITVPRSSLVLQFQDEMINEYSIPEEYIGLWDGNNKTWLNQPILVTTRQSLSKQRKKEGRKKLEIIRDVTQRVIDKKKVMLFIDECHQANCMTITEIIEMIKPPWIFGFTGTTPETEVETMEIISLLGNIIYSKKTKELISLGFLPQMNITILTITHDKKKYKKFLKDYETDKEKQKTKIKAELDKNKQKSKLIETIEEEEEEQKNEKYLCEIDYLADDDLRNNVLKKITENFTAKGENVLILVERIIHGQTLQKWIPGSVFLYGGDNAKVRYEIQKQCELESGKIIIATSGIFAMGVSIKRLHAVILAGISSAKISLLQAIGRGLRKHKSKTVLKIFDISDTTQYSRRHLRKRLKVFDNEGFIYKEIEV